MSTGAATGYIQTEVPSDRAPEWPTGVYPGIVMAAIVPVAKSMKAKTLLLQVRGTSHRKVPSDTPLIKKREVTVAGHPSYAVIVLETTLKPMMPSAVEGTRNKVWLCNTPP